MIAPFQSINKLIRSCPTHHLSLRRQLLSSQCSHYEEDDRDGHRWQRRHRVVITGIGAITPIGPDIESTWQAVLQTRHGNNGEHSQCNGITSLYSALQQQNLTTAQFEKEWEMLQSLSCQVAASVPEQWISNHPRILSPGETPPQWLNGRTSRFTQLALIAAQEAVNNSGLNEWLGCDHTQQTSQSTDPNHTIKNRRETFGVSIGNGMSSTRDISMASSKSLRKISPHFVPQILPNSPAARIAIHHNLHGPNLSHSEACAAGAAAIAQAVELIRSGRVQGMVAGGCESAVEALGLAGFSRLRALSSGSCTNNDIQSKEEEKHAAQSSSRPFDSQRNGFVLAEGAAMLVLEEYDHAVSRGAPILGEVLGVGYSGDAFHITAPEPTGKGAARAMLQSVEDAGSSMNDVDYVNAHATSTPIGDVAEINAIRLALSRTKQVNEENGLLPLLVSSTKGATGHLLGAAGAIEAALTVMAMSKNTAPHTRNLDVISEDILPELWSNDALSTKTRRSIHLVQHAPNAQALNIAMSNSFGFGGTNISLLLGKVE